MFDFFDICYKNIDIKRSKFSGISEGDKKGIKRELKVFSEVSGDKHHIAGFFRRGKIAEECQNLFFQFLLHR